MSLKPIGERFWAKVDLSNGPYRCWEWLGYHNPKTGYGQFYWSAEERTTTAHRTAYKLTNGDIPEGLVIDHLCRNRGCVNPRHLEVVTALENVLRGISPAAKRAAQTHCKRGHEFNERNIYKPPSGNGQRVCRQCQNEHAREQRRQKKAHQGERPK